MDLFKDDVKATWIQHDILYVVKDDFVASTTFGDPWDGRLHDFSSLFDETLAETLRDGFQAIWARENDLYVVRCVDAPLSLPPAPSSPRGATNGQEQRTVESRMLRDALGLPSKSRARTFDRPRY